MAVSVEVVRTPEVFVTSGPRVFFWDMRDANHFWGYNVAPYPNEVGFRSVHHERTDFTIDSDGTQTATLWVYMDGSGSIFFSALSAPLFV